MKIECALKMVKMYGRDYFQHIYVVVPKFTGADLSKRNNYYVIDPVLDKFDEEAPEINEAKYKKMSIEGMPIQYLNGVTDARLGEEFNGLGDNLGNTDSEALHKDFHRRLKTHLVNTRNHLAKHPHSAKHIYNVPALIGAYDQLIGAWDNEHTRAATLEKLSGQDESFLQPSLQGLGDIIHGGDNELFGLINADLSGINGLSGKKTAARKAATGKTTKTKKAGVFTKIKNASKIAKKATTAVKNASKAVKEKSKAILKKVGKAVVKDNPALIPVRAGFLVGMKTNVLRIASRAYWALFPETDALNAKVSKSYYDKAQRCYAYLKTIFVTKLKGDESALQKAIITGRAAKIAKKLAAKGKLNGIDELAGLSGLGVIAAATVTAAMGFLTTIAAFFTKVMGKQGDSDAEEAETGGDTNATSPDAANALTQTDPGPVVPNDGSEKLYNQFVDKNGGGSPAASSDDNSQGGSSGDDESDHATGRSMKPAASTPSAPSNNGGDTPNNGSISNTSDNTTTDKPISKEEVSAAVNQDGAPDKDTDKPDTGKKSGAGKAVAAVIAVAAVGTIAAVAHKKLKAKKGTSGLSGVAEKAMRKKIQKVTLT
jgi:hypothetical protein